MCMARESRNAEVHRREPITCSTSPSALTQALSFPPLIGAKWPANVRARMFARTRAPRQYSSSARAFASRASASVTGSFTAAVEVIAYAVGQERWARGGAVVGGPGQQSLGARWGRLWRLTGTRDASRASAPATTALMVIRQAVRFS